MKQINQNKVPSTSILILIVNASLLSAAPAAFSLVAPDSVWLQTHSPAFIWQASSGASQYDLWIDGKQAATGMTGVSCIAQQPLAPGRHTWFVKATGGGATVSSADTDVFMVETPPQHMWDCTDGFERGDLNDYISDGIAITSNALDGARSATYATPSSMVMHYAMNPAFTNEQEAEASVLFSLDDPNADVGVGFAAENGVWCYAILDRAHNALNVERRATYSIFPHTEAGYTKANWTERQENGFYVWCADSQPLPALAQGTKYRLRFDLSNRLPSMGKAAQAVLETETGTVLKSLQSILDDVYAPHPLFIVRNGAARADDFRFQLLDRWSYNWVPHQGPLNPAWAGFNPAVWRDANKKWWLTARTDNKIRWSTDGVNWSDQTANAPPVSIMDPATLGVAGNPWSDGRTYLASCDGCCYNPVQIYYSTDPGSGVWTKWAEHAGLPDCGREHVFLDTKDWPTLSPIAYNGTAYRFLSILEGDVGKGGSTMIKLSNDELNYVKIECTDLYGNAANAALEQQNQWMMECLNSATSSAVALDGDIRVMGFKDGMRYEKAFPQEIILDGKAPWKVKAIQTIPGFPYYWGDWHKARDKAGASWYGGKYEWPSCFVWVSEEKKIYSYWGEENTINLSTALVVPQFCCAALMADTANVSGGGQVAVGATIWNYGDADGIDTVQLTSDGGVVDTKILSLAANTDTAVVFSLIAQAAGPHVLSIDNCKTAILVTGPSAVAAPATGAAFFPKAPGPWLYRIIDLHGKTVRMAKAGRPDVAPAQLCAGCAKGVYVVQVLEENRVIKSLKVMR
ncbi:MAG TPA: hypothetical protein VLX68_08190 [Chitinivibrionales bacterium]|nr:hypothetical protein [Chitinivibrionales bacterium]